MNKAELAQSLSEKLNVSKREGEDMLNTLLDIITATLKKGDEVVLTGFGAFSARAVASFTSASTSAARPRSSARSAPFASHASWWPTGSPPFNTLTKSS